MARLKQASSRSPTVQVDVDFTNSLDFEIKESFLLENDNRKECQVLASEDAELLPRDYVIQSWRKQNPKCECSLNSERCPAASATRADIFEAASKGNTKTLTWYFRNFEPKELLLLRDASGWNVVHHLSLLENTASLELVSSSVPNFAYLDLPEHNDLGRTPLMIAANAGNLAAVEFLSHNNARTTAKSAEDKNCQDYGAQHQRIKTFFETFVGDNNIWLAESLRIFPNVAGVNRSDLLYQSRSEIKSKPEPRGENAGGDTNSDYETLSSRRPAASRSASAFLSRTRSSVNFCPSPARSGLGGKDGANLSASRGRAEYLAACRRCGVRPLDSTVGQLAGHSMYILPGSLSPSAAAPLAAGLRANGALRHLSIDGCVLGDDAGARLLSALGGLPLETLVLRRLGLGAAAAKALASLLCSRGWAPRLGTLVLDGNRLADRGVELIAEALLKAGASRRKLSDLSLSANHLGSTWPSAAARIGDLLHATPATCGLLRLDLSWNCLGPVDCETILRAVGGYRSNSGPEQSLGFSRCGLRSLSLAWNRLGDPGWAAACAAIGGSESLEHLDLTHCGVPRVVTPEHALLSNALEECLRCNTALRVLRLDFTSLRIEEGAAVRAVLQRREPPISFLPRPGILQIPYPSLTPGRSLQGHIPESSKPVAGSFGHYRLDLAVHTHRMVAEDLARRARTHHGENWRNEIFDGSRFSFDNGWIVPENGSLELDFCNLSEPMYSCKMESKALKTLKRMLQSSTDLESSLGILEKVSARYFLAAKDVFDILFLFSGPVRIEVAITLLSCVLDRENIALIFSALTKQQKLRLFSLIPNILLFNPRDPSGTYTLDVSKTLDRKFLLILARIMRHNSDQFNPLPMDHTTCLRRGIIQIQFNGESFDGPWNLHLYCTQSFTRWLQKLATDEDSEIEMPQIPAAGILEISFQHTSVSPDVNCIKCISESKANLEITTRHVEKTEIVQSEQQVRGCQETDLSQPPALSFFMEPSRDFCEVTVQNTADNLGQLPNEIRRPGTAPSLGLSRSSLSSPLTRKGMHVRPHTSHASDSTQLCNKMEVQVQTELEQALSHYKNCRPDSLAPFGDLTLTFWNSEDSRWVCPACLQPFLRKENFASHIENVHKSADSNLKEKFAEVSERLSELHMTLTGSRNSSPGPPSCEKNLMKGLKDLAHISTSKDTINGLAFSNHQEAKPASDIDCKLVTSPEVTSDERVVFYDVFQKYTSVTRATEQMLNYRRAALGISKSLEGARALSARATGSGWKIQRIDPVESEKRPKWTWGVPISPLKEGENVSGNQDWRLCKVQFEVNRRQSSAAQSPKTKRLFQAFEAPMIDFRPGPGKTYEQIAATKYDELQAVNTGKDRLAWEGFLVTQQLHSELLGWLE